MLIEVWPAVHSLMKPTEFSASRSVTDLAERVRDALLRDDLDGAGDPGHLFGPAGRGHDGVLHLVRRRLASSGVVWQYSAGR